MVTFSVGTGSNPISFELQEMKAAEKRSEFQELIFGLADKVSILERTVKKLETENHQAKSSKSVTSTGGGDTKSKTPAKPKQTGMSVLNPGSKKRKTAKGVSFE